MGEETARKLGANARAAGVRLSLHAPYFINLANPDPESLEKTPAISSAACRAADWMGAGRVVIHSGALMKRTRRQALVSPCTLWRRWWLPATPRAMDTSSCALRPWARSTSWGIWTRCSELCQVDERLLPTVDFGHLYARSLGADEGEEATERMLDKLSAALGEERTAASTAIFPHSVYARRGREDAPHL